MPDRQMGCCVDRACTEGTCMRLPEGVTCGDCRHFGRCAALFDAKAENQACDFFPRRLMLREVSRA